MSGSTRRPPAPARRGRREPRLRGCEAYGHGCGRTTAESFSRSPLRSPLVIKALTICTVWRSSASRYSERPRMSVTERPQLAQSSVMFSTLRQSADRSADVGCSPGTFGDRCSDVVMTWPPKMFGRDSVREPSAYVVSNPPKMFGREDERPRGPVQSSPPKILGRQDTSPPPLAGATIRTTKATRTSDTRASRDFIGAYRDGTISPRVPAARAGRGPGRSDRAGAPQSLAPDGA